MLAEVEEALVHGSDWVPVFGVGRLHGGGLRPGAVFLHV